MNNCWEPCKLKDICIQITDGKHGDCASESNSGFYFLSAKDISNGSINYEKARQITRDDFSESHRRTNFEPLDILFTNSGTIGRMAIAKNEDRTQRTTFQKSVAILKPNKASVEPHFLYYLLLCDNRRLSDFAAGTAQKNLLLKDLRDFPVRIPSRPIQRRISAVLSAYDDLIANNTRRIQILEEMARRIYEEWFVRFRFPAHENIVMEESELGMIPEGWKVQPLEKILSTLAAGARPKGGIDPKERGVPSIGAENINGLGNYDFSKEKYVSNIFYERMKRGKVKSEDVMLYKDGAYVGRKALFRDGYPHAESAVNEHVFILRTDATVSQTYLYFWLDLPQMTGKIKALNANAAQPGINQVGVKSLPILIPLKVVLEDFEEHVEPCLTLLFNLAKKNQNLKATRDLLLPKLISGELDVSHFPEPMSD